MLTSCTTPVTPSGCKTETRYLYFCNGRGGPLKNCNTAFMEFCQGYMPQLLIKKDKK